MKQVIIVHGWEGEPNSNWFPWLARELTARGYTVDMPQFPLDHEPKLEDWLAVLKKQNPDAKTILVGHSLGAITILRYLETNKNPIAGAVLVSGFARPIMFSELNDFFKTPVDFAKVREHCNSFTVISSDNDPFVPLAEGEHIAQGLHVKLTVAHGMGHISKNQGNVTEYPPVLDAVLKVKL